MLTKTVGRCLRALGGFALVLGMATPVRAAPLEEVRSFKPLLQRALTMPIGEPSRARLVGPVAALLQARTGKASDIILTATPVAAFAKPGCRRVALTMGMPSVLLARKDGGVSEPLSLNLAFNMCPDGSPPLEGANLAGASDALRARVPPPPSLPMKTTP